MREYDKQPDDPYLTVSELKAEFPKAAKKYHWCSKMFFYLFRCGIVQRQFNNSIKTYEYSRNQLVNALRLVNNNLDDGRIDLDD